MVASVSHPSHLDLVSSLNDSGQLSVILLQIGDPLSQHLDLLISLVVVSLQLLLVHDSSLLLQLLVLVPQLLSVFLQLTQLSLFIVKDFVKTFK